MRKNARRHAISRLSECNPAGYNLSLNVLSPVSIQTQSLSLRALRLDGNRAKRKRLRWQAANHGCHCFDRASYWLQAQTVYGSGRAVSSQWVRAIDTQPTNNEFCCFINVS